MTSLTKQFQVGQTVSIKELEYGCQVTVLAAGQAGPQVVEVGSDYVVFEDAGAGIRTRIPVHVIHALQLPPEALAQSA